MSELRSHFFRSFYGSDDERCNVEGLIFVYTSKESPRIVL